MIEITMRNLLATGKIDLNDFLARAEKTPFRSYWEVVNQPP